MPCSTRKTMKKDLRWNPRPYLDPVIYCEYRCRDVKVAASLDVDQLFMLDPGQTMCGTLVDMAMFREMNVYHEALLGLPAEVFLLHTQIWNGWTSAPTCRRYRKSVYVNSDSITAPFVFLLVNVEGIHWVVAIVVHGGDLAASSPNFDKPRTLIIVMDSLAWTLAKQVEDL